MRKDFKNELEQHHYFSVIEDFNFLMNDYGTQQVLDDLKLLSLTNYEDLVKIVMRTEKTEKKVAAIFRNAGKN